MFFMILMALAFLAFGVLWGVMAFNTKSLLLAAAALASVAAAVFLAVMYFKDKLARKRAVQDDIAQEYSEEEQVQSFEQEKEDPDLYEDAPDETEDEMYYCPHCGSYSLSNGISCAVCGEKISQ